MPRKLVHEIWEIIDDRGQVLPTLGLAGPYGDDFRRLLHEEALECDGARLDAWDASRPAVILR